MTETEIGIIVVAVITAAGAIAGTVWTQRKDGPEMTQVVLGSMSDHVARLDATIDEMRAELDVLRAEMTAMEHALAVERSRNALLIAAMRQAGLTVPRLPDRPAPAVG